MVPRSAVLTALVLSSASPVGAESAEDTDTTKPAVRPPRPVATAPT
jgi:hypothetical protein